MQRGILLLLVTMSLIAVPAGAVHAGPPMLTLFNATYSPSGTTPYACSPCHTPSGPPLNPYGQAFNAANGDANVFDGTDPRHLAALRTIEPLDSDGDGFANIAEITARTLPGDASSTPSAATMPAPAAGQVVIGYAAVADPVVDANPLVAKPVGVGAVSTGGDTFNIQVGLLPFTGPVDLYFLILAPAVSADPFILTPAGLQSLSVAGPVPWKDDVQPGQISEVLLPDFPVGQFPEGDYILGLVAAPTNSLNAFYFWVTDFTIGPRDLSFHLRSMQPHLNQLTEISVVSASSVLQARAILDPLTDANFDLVMRRAVPAGAHRLDFFSDFNNNRLYNAPPTDHAWRLGLPATGAPDLTFVHNTTFTDISTPSVIEAGDFTLNLTAMNPHLNQLFELRVIEEATNRTVGLYRLGAIPLPAFAVTIPGIIGVGIQYRVDFFADFNNNKLCDAPPTDHTWRLTGTGGPTGLTLSFDHNANFTNVCQ